MHGNGACSAGFKTTVLPAMHSAMKRKVLAISGISTHHAAGAVLGPGLEAARPNPGGEIVQAHAIAAAQGDAGVRRRAPA
jgi:hypothetical protein